MKRKFCQDQQCRRAGKRLALDQFPRNRTMKDGRFSYCLECASRKTKEYRLRLRAKKAAQPHAERKKMIIAKPRFIALSKVYNAIAEGARTRKEIKAKTELNYDLIGDALCELLWARGIVIKDREFVLIEHAA